MLRFKIAAVIAATLIMTTDVLAQEYRDIRLPNQLVARIRAAGPHGSLSQREAATYQAITNALSNELHNIFDRQLGGPRLTVHQRNGVWTLSIGNQMLIQAFPEDAAGAGMTTQQLINQWRANFAQQLPRAVSPLRVPEWWAQANPEATATAEKRMHDLPPHDAPLVREVAELLDYARELPTERFQELEPAMERVMVERIWSYRHLECGLPPIAEHIRCRSVLRRAHGLSDEQYNMEKWWLAGETIKVVRAAMNVPEGVGPIPAERELPDFDAPLEPIETPAVPAPVITTPDPVVETDPAAEAAADDTAAAPSAPEVTDGPAPVSIVPGTPIQIAAMGTGLGESSLLLNMGQQFTAPVDQLLVYIQLADAAPATVLGVILRDAEGKLAQRRIPVTGDRRLAVTFSAGLVGSFEPGEYECRFTIDGKDAGRIPFQILAGPGRLN